MVAAGDAAAYVDGRGRLVAAYPDGHRTLLGRPTTYSPLVSSPSGVWCPGSMPARTGVQRLLVWDLTEQRKVSGVVVSGLRTEPIGFDGGWLTFRTGTTDFVWNPHGGEPDPDRRRRAAGRRRPLGLLGRHRAPAPGSSRSGRPSGWSARAPGRTTYLPGVSGSLSADGRLVITRPVDRGEPRLYDARTGERLDSWYPGGWRVLDATFVGDDRVAWLADRDDGDAVLVVCGSPGQPMDCAVAHDLGATGTPVIARDSLG